MVNAHNTQGVVNYNQLPAEQVSSAWPQPHITTSQQPGVADVYAHQAALGRH